MLTTIINLDTLFDILVVKQTSKKQAQKRKTHTAIIVCVQHTVNSHCYSSIQIELEFLYISTRSVLLTLTAKRGLEPIFMVLWLKSNQISAPRTTYAPCLL